MSRQFRGHNHRAAVWSLGSLHPFWWVAVSHSASPTYCFALTAALRACVSPTGRENRFPPVLTAARRTCVFKARARLLCSLRYAPKQRGAEPASISIASKLGRNTGCQAAAANLSPSGRDGREAPVRALQYCERGVRKQRAVAQQSNGLSLAYAAPKPIPLPSLPCRARASLKARPRLSSQPALRPKEERNATSVNKHCQRLGCAPDRSIAFRPLPIATQVSRLTPTAIHWH
jgi:hypothetical protein